MHSILLQSGCTLWLVMGTLFQGCKKGSTVLEVGSLLFIVCVAMFLGLKFDVKLWVRSHCGRKMRFISPSLAVCYLLSHSVYLMREQVEHTENFIYTKMF